MKKNWLKGKTFIVTGASSGLGKELAKLLINDGAAVIGIGRSKDKFERLVKELGENAQLEFALFDVGDKACWAQFAEDIARKNRAINGIINCAGILPPFDRAIATSTEAVEEAMRVNFLSCVYAINAIYPLMNGGAAREGKGAERPAIVNICSSAALATIAGTSAYSASKSALKSYTEALIVEMRKEAYVALVMPGFAKTDIFRKQNSQIEESRLISAMSMPAEKMANKIYRGIKRRKTRMIFGKDAHIMNLFYRICPRTMMNLTAKILKRANVKLFENVFTEK